MRLIDNEDGVSELVGFMLILLIIMIFMSMLQVYEMPKWNKDLEIGLFDDVRNDFLEIRHDISTVAIENAPITSNIRMGVRYPEHFMLRNPGPGASGTLTFEPVNVNLTIGSDKQNYTSYRIKYKMNGISTQPELIYEHGLIISDYGSVQLNESSQSIIEGNRIFLPMIFSQFQSVSGMAPESLNIMPVSIDNYSVITAPSTINILLETKYPDLWNKTIGNVSGVKLTNISGIWYLNITKTLSLLMYPPAMSGGLFSGMITTELPARDGVPSGRTGKRGTYSNDMKSMNRINIPSSSEMQNFVIHNITTITNFTKDKIFSFVVTGQNDNFFEAKITILSGNPPTTAKVDIYYNGYHQGLNPTFSVPLSSGVNLTSYYRNASINRPNSLIITEWESEMVRVVSVEHYLSNILYIRLLICDIANPC